MGVHTVSVIQFEGISAEEPILHVLQKTSLYEIRVSSKFYQTTERNASHVTTLEPPYHPRKTIPCPHALLSVNPTTRLI
jgi:pyrimidine deaminase RibD-like protein